MTLIFKTMTLALLMASASLVAADLRVARYFSNHMVLQRQKPIVVHGWAAPGAAVRLACMNQEKSGTADETGQWSITLDALKATSKPSDLIVTAGKEKIALKDIVVGDVILFARQTTIDISLGRSEAGRKAAAAGQASAAYRMITLRMVPAPKPRNDLAEAVTTGWTPVDKDSALTMSAAAYYLGLDLNASTHIPVGIVDANLGGYLPFAWLSRETLVGDSAGQANRVKSMETMYDAFVSKSPYGKHKKIITENPLEHPLYPAAGYNAILHPLRGIGLKGLILQLGNDYPYMYYEKSKTEKTNTDRVVLNNDYVLTYNLRKEGYRMEPTMIALLPKEWRAALGDATLPVAYVMPPASDLEAYAIHNREMRELQRREAAAGDDIGIIVPGMAAVPFSGQPKDEKGLADRAAMWVKSAVLKEKDRPATGPDFERLTTKDGVTTVHFKAGTAKGLKAAKGALDDFEVADVDAQYVPAKAVIDGEMITLTCESISRIFYVRYNWQQKPNEGLINSAGLPAIPFRTQNAPYQWFIRYDKEPLPMEYTTPANQWKDGSVTLVNGQLKKVGYTHFSGWLGPVGVLTGPFGPNMGVREVSKGSPADGKLFADDIIYSANGRMLGEEEEQTMAAAITASEAKDGKLVLGVHRGDENRAVTVQLEHMGRYSATAPWNCQKTDKIVANLERYLARRGAPLGFLCSDGLFMLAAGSPQYQGLVRRSIEPLLKAKPGETTWYLGSRTMLLSEYYLSTGDKRALPAIKRFVDKIADLQIKEEGSRRYGGWYGRGNNPRGYPAMVNAGQSCMLGMTLAKETGVAVDPRTYQDGMDYLIRKGVPVGQIIYGDAFRTQPSIFTPEDMLAGKLHSSNGKLGKAAVMYRLLGDRKSMYMNSLVCTHAWYSTFSGHGGNFWNNVWTPLGAAANGRDSLIYFMKGNRWYRECNRMYDGSLIVMDGKQKFGGGTGLPLVVPRARLRMLGAPQSPFSPGAPEALKAALAAYDARDYSKAETLAKALISTKGVGKADAPTVNKLAEEAVRMRESIAADLAQIAKLIPEGRVCEAQVILNSLKAVTSEGDPEMVTAMGQLKGAIPRDNDKERYAMERKGGQGTDGKIPKNSTELKQMQAAEKAAKAAAKAALGTWECLTPKLFIPKNTNSKPQLGEALAEAATQWRFSVLENLDNAPEGWMKPGFDDSGWTETALPISWHLNHPIVARATFTVKDRAAYDLLRFRSWLFRQQNVAIYLNGVLIGRVNNLLKKTGDVEADFNKQALEALKDGENTLAVSTRQNWRWGMLGMRVYNDGFDFMLDARLPAAAKSVE